jgi:hypothetical protein
MLGSSLKDRMSSPDELAEISQQNIEIGRDRLKQFSNRAHDTSLIN